MNRRDFVSNTGAAVGVSAIFGNGQANALLPILTNVDAVASWQKAPCRFCGTGCGVEVGIADGKVVAVRGDVASPVNRGLLCAKGYHLPGILYGSDRLLTPLRRSADRKSWISLSWDEALDLIATKYQESLSKHGPESVGIYGSGQWTVFDGYAALKWFKAGMRSNNIEANARLCMASAVTGYMTQFQSDEPMGCYDDFDLGDDFVLWGNNMAECHPVLFSRILEHKRKSPWVRIYDLATRRTPTSDLSDLTVMFKPGTDLALANGIMHVIVNQNFLDESFIAENVVFKRGIEDLAKIGYGCFDEQAEKYAFKDETKASSFAELRSFLSDYSPEKVGDITGVSPSIIRMLGEMYGNRQRGTVSVWCMGVNQHVRGTWMNNLITDLHLLTGKICRPGSNPMSLTGQPSACGTVREVGTLCDRLPADMNVGNPEHRAKAEHIWKLPAGSINPKPGLHTVDMFRAFTRGDLKTLWIQTTNPWVSLPNLHRFERKADDGRFLVVSDIYPTPTTEAADLVLPSAAWVEREGVFGNTERRTTHWAKMVDAPGEAREDAWQLVQVAKKMGFGNLFPWNDADFHREMYEEYRRFGLGIGKDLASYEQLLASRGLRWPVVDGKETKYRYTAGHDPYVKKASGAHFYKAKDYGQKAAVWLRPYQAPAEAPDKEFPFWLSTGRVLEHWHTGSMTRRVKQLHEAVPGSYVEMNPADAQELGLTDGERVRVVSRRGKLELPLKLDGVGRPIAGSLFIPFFDEGLLANWLTLDAMDNISKEPDYKKCAVRVERTAT